MVLLNDRDYAALKEFWEIDPDNDEESAIELAQRAMFDSVGTDSYVTSQGYTVSVVEVVDSQHPPRPNLHFALVLNHEKILFLNPDNPQDVGECQKVGRKYAYSPFDETLKINLANV